MASLVLKPRAIRLLPVRTHTGYISFEGRLDTRVNRESRMEEQLRSVDLRPLKRLKFAFDPFHPSVTSVRDALNLLSDPRIRKTNPKCIFKTDILHQNEEPRIEAELLESKETIVFKTENLIPREIFYHMNKIFLPLIPPDVPVTEVKTKTNKKMGKKK
eukprot:TRINITY_DN1504_c0_g1_i1.p1 TRINITY_DN1504_c0_g1~~TRINITY_DN1504_c0_g1_i1.p1  ORF type:complete len:159 (+),score=47.23 TRINITY_DN1504_c0_g1_i1:202-678(+)